MFGRAKVRIIHHNSNQRARWLTALGAAALAAAVWLLWPTPQPAEHQQSADIPLPLSVDAPPAAPAHKPEHIPPRAIPHALNNSPANPPQSVSTQAAISPKSVTPQPQVLSVAAHSALPAKSDSALPDKTSTPILNKLSSPIQPQSSTEANSLSDQQTAYSPVAAAPLPLPLAQESSDPLSASDK